MPDEKKDIIKMLDEAKAKNKAEGIEGLTDEQRVEIGKAICDNATLNDD